MVGQDFSEIEKGIGLFLSSGKITLEFKRQPKCQYVKNFRC